MRVWMAVWSRPSAAAAFGVFCLLSSSVYLMNDLKDIEKDRQHPEKRKRPLASGALSPALAVVVAVILGIGGVAAAAVLRPAFAAVGAGKKPAEFAKLLAELPDDTIPYVVLSAFAGLRPMEVRRLNWADINFQTGLITVKTGTDKTKRRRTVPMMENLRAWL